MAAISACCTPTSSAAPTGLFHKRINVSAPSPSALGLPGLGKKGIVRCSIEGKSRVEVEESSSKLGMGGSLIGAALGATSTSPAAMALVDDRLSTEGTGLPFGLSNNLLGWILLGVFALIWSFYIVYTSSLEEDEESGLSL